MMNNCQPLKSLDTISASWKKFIESLDPSEKGLFYELEKIGQLHVLEKLAFSADNAESLIHDLKEIALFFEGEGGLVGYQKALQDIKNCTSFDMKVHKAEGIDLKHFDQNNQHAVKVFIQHLPELAEVYAIGGAADRLNLMSNHKMLPAACLELASKSLLEYLIKDLEAKEWLYFKLYHKTLTQPCVMMTSFEKDNQAHIYNILETHRFFDRPKESFYIFHQPLVPMVDENLNWQVTDQHLFLKPGGHGVIWALCDQHKVFDYLEKAGIKKVSIRQINNPIACIDYGHLAFLGYGFWKNADFGFFACQRKAGSQEGINVILENRFGQYCLSNIEYCQLKQAQIDDAPNFAGYSEYPANTNVLFADVKGLKDWVKINRLPGKILNYKKFTLGEESVSLARLETTMQNIADSIVEKTLPLKRSFMTLAPRYKTISPIKRQKVKGGSFEETPQACFYDFMKNASELLEACEVSHPPLGSIEDYYEKTPFIFTYLPALGPLYQIISQKIKKGYLGLHSYLNVNFPEVILKDFKLEGALILDALNPYGLSSSSKRQFSDRAPRVKIINCQFYNKGIDLDNSISIEQNLPDFNEKFELVLEGFSEFEAINVVFNGNFLIKVPDGHKMIAKNNDKGNLVFECFKIDIPSWVYTYLWDQDHLLVKEGDLQ